MPDGPTDNPFMAALEQFEAAEANLVKLERLWKELQKLMPSGVSFGPNPEYEDRQRSYDAILQAIPKIDGWRPEASPPDLDDLAQNRFDAAEIGELSAHVSVERWAEAPGRELGEYRFRLNSKRRALIRDSLVQLIDAVDADVRAARAQARDAKSNERLADEHWHKLREHVKQVEVLLGSSVSRPPRWGDLLRHMSFGCVGDLNDIERFDWPQAKASLRQGLYGENEPLPVAVDDLSSLVSAKPKGAVTTKLEWDQLDDEGFERVLFALISSEQGYENPEWLMQTRAPDRGRDLSVTRVRVDGLSGVTRQRVVIQCKHWRAKSVALGDVTTAKDQMALWPHPPVAVLVIATSGRFTADAVQWVEQYNARQETPQIEMWPESHLERLLAERPALIAEHGLR